jgi:hypothetical protein
LTTSATSQEFSAKSEADVMAKVTAARRLCPAQLSKIPESVRVKYRQGRMEFLSKNLASVELGILEPVWSSFAQRLDYALESKFIAGAGMDQGTLARLVGIEPSVLSDYRSRRRSNTEQGIEESTAPLAGHVLNLLQAADAEVELAWVLGGSQAVDDKTFRSRYIMALKLNFGEEWKERAREAKVFPAEIITTIGSEAALPLAERERWATALSQRTGPAISASWLMTGKTEPPPAIRAAMQAIAAEGPIVRWDRKLDEPVQVSMTSRQLLMLVKLIEEHNHEIPADALHQIRTRIWWPLAYLGIVTPLRYIEDAKDSHDLEEQGQYHLSEEAIRDRREGVFKAFRRPAG